MCGAFVVIKAFKFKDKLKGEGRVSCESKLYDKGKRKIDARNLSGRTVIDLF